MGTNVSKLAVVVSADSSGFAGGLAPARAGLDGLKQSAAGAESALGGLTGILAGVGVAAVALEAFKYGFGEFTEKEDAIAQLNARLKSTGEAAGFSSEQLRGMADDLQQINGVGDEATIGAQQLLLSFTSIKGDVFKEALLAAEDLSAGMGTDLKGSVMQLGKALQDPTAGLASLHRVGVAFTDSQKEQIKTLQASGDIMGAQRIMLAELATEFGGSAAAKAQTLTGRIAALKAEFGDVAGEIFSVFVPALKSIADAGKLVAGFINAHIEQFQALAAGLLWPVTMLGKVAGLFGDSGAAAADAKTHFDATKATLSATAAASEDTAKAQEKLAESVKTTTDHLQLSVDTFGMSTHAAEAYKLKIAGATVEQLAQAEALAKTLDGLEKQKKAWEELQSAAKKYIDDIKTPYEKLAETLDKINELERAGLLTADQATRASTKAADDLRRGDAKREKKLEAASRDRGGIGAEKLGTFERRFTAGFTAENGPIADQQLKEMKKTAKATERTAKATEKLAGATGTPVATDVGA
jgi:hypothetical protein